MAFSLRKCMDRSSFVYLFFFFSSSFEIGPCALCDDRQGGTMGYNTYIIPRSYLVYFGASRFGASSQDSPEEELRNHSTLRKHHLLLFLCDSRLLLLYLWNVCLSMIDWSEPVVRNPSVYQSISTWLIYTMLMPVHAETCIWQAIESRPWTMIGCTAEASLWTRAFQNYHWIVLVLTYGVL